MLIKMLIGLQAGHQNIQSNPDPVLQTETGAPGEETLNVTVRDRLGQILIAHGFPVQLDDANADVNPNTTGTNFDFYLALHAESEPEGGAISAPDPSYDQVNDVSKRICSVIESVYFEETGITDNPKIITSNMTEYYMWNSLTASTPCGIIEMGAIVDPHDSVLLANTELIAGAIAKGICKAFNVPFDTTPEIASVQSTQAQAQSQTPVESLNTTPTTSENTPKTASVVQNTVVINPQSSLTEHFSALGLLLVSIFKKLLQFFITG
ncbi:MAG: hypothetical protein ACRDFB_03135 [Rhabdochlamydiaceae bacterium]